MTRLAGGEAVAPIPGGILGWSVLVLFGLAAGLLLATQGRTLAVLFLLSPLVVLPLSLRVERLYTLVTCASIALVMLTPPWFNLSFVTHVESDSRLSLPRVIALLQLGCFLLLAAHAIVRRGARDFVNRLPH
jgi:hypothetical protein